MSGIELILVAAVLMGASGVPGILGSRGSPVGERLAAGLMLAGGAIGLFGTLCAADGGGTLSAAGGLPWGRLSVGVDAVSRVFLAPVFLVPALGAVYGLGYWRQSEHPESGRGLRLFYGLMPAAMVLVAVARDGVVLLLAWEIMAISAFFLVCTEDDSTEARRAGWVYFVAAHLGALTLFAMFAVIRHATGTFAMEPLGAHLAPAAASGVFLLALVGFGLKAGLMPLHVWLPGAHASAPSHVSAVLSGVMLKMGVYGLVRVTSLLPTGPVWWGGLLLGLGGASAVLGIAFAVGQQDFKRLLAYSSVENIGIITMGLGLALVGRSLSQPAWVVLGLGGALLHVWNHALFKPLLFFGAGSVMHATGTRRIDRLGGLAGTMSRSAALVLVGAAAICALPPLNGFVSELLIYLGLFRTLGPVGSWPLGALAVPTLALVGALAAAAFAKLFGGVFLGAARSEDAAGAHEAPVSMLGPMAVLAVLCGVVGVAPGAFLGVIDGAIGAWGAPAGLSVQPISGVVSLGWLAPVGLGLLGAAVVGVLLLRRRMASGVGGAAERPGTWDCGYARPTARMQYTGSSLGQVLVGLFSFALWARVRRPEARGLFPSTGRFESEVPDTVLDRAVLPLFRAAERFLPWVRLLQQGQIQVYVLYVLLVVVALFVSMYVA